MYRYTQTHTHILSCALKQRQGHNIHDGTSWNETIRPCKISHLMSFPVANEECVAMGKKDASLDSWETHTITGPAESWHLHAIVLKFTQPKCWHLIVCSIEQLLSPWSNFEGSAVEPVCLYDRFTCGAHRSVCVQKLKMKMLETVTSTWMLEVWAYSMLTRESGSESPSYLSFF